MTTTTTGARYRTKPPGPVLNRNRTKLSRSHPGCQHVIGTSLSVQLLLPQKKGGRRAVPSQPRGVGTGRLPLAHTPHTGIHSLC